MNRVYTPQSISFVCCGHDGVFSSQFSSCNSVHCCGGKVCRSLLINFCFRVWNIDLYVFSGKLEESNVYAKVDDADNGKQPVFLSWKVHRYNKMLVVVQ